MAKPKVLGVCVSFRGRLHGYCSYLPSFVGYCDGCPIFAADFRAGTVLYSFSRRRKVLAGWACYLGISWRLLGAEGREGLIMGFLRKVSSDRKDAEAGRLGIDELELQKWPCLYEHLTDTCYPDGQPRATSTITIFWGTQGLTATLNDRDNEQACFASGSGLVALLSALDAMAANPDTVWRSDKNKTGSSSRKRR